MTDLRFDWGPAGAASLAGEADIAVVVDVLSFTTTLSIAVERGMTVFPYEWKGPRAEQYAAERDAVLAIGRFEDSGAGGVTLSPAAMSRVEGVQRIVLPSPNGSSICFALADSGLTVVGACLRNRAAVARWLAPRLAAGERIAVVASGERWPDGSLRPGLEDLWGAGAVLAALEPREPDPEARHAALAFAAASRRLTADLLACASGVELVEAGFRGDVLLAAELDVSDVVPVLTGEAFAAAG